MKREEALTWIEEDLKREALRKSTKIITYSLVLHQGGIANFSKRTDEDVRIVVKEDRSED